MKKIIVLCDGMADLPLEQLGNKTPMEAAKKPNMNLLASKGEMGLVKTIPNGFAPGSDVANLSVLGYKPEDFYTGRSPLEAASMRIKLDDDDIAFRMNLVTLSDEENYSDKTMVDYCGGDISTEDATVLVNYLKENLENEQYKFYPGISYRHCLVIKHCHDDLGRYTPPHDISDKCVKDHLPAGGISSKLLDLMKTSYDLLMKHPINIERIKKGIRPANSIWLWGYGNKTILEDFKKRYGVSGSMVSAVDLLKGIAVSANMHVVNVEGATGYIDTNFAGKTAAAIKELNDGQDFVYLHFEAPDECGHRGEIENKKNAIELIDKTVLGTLLPELEKYDDYKLMVLPDHPTPLSIKTHTTDPVPFMIYQKTEEKDNGKIVFCEKTCKKTGLYFESGYDLFNHFISD